MTLLFSQRRLVRYLAGLVLFLPWSPLLAGQEVHYRPLTVDDGLAQNAVTCITQDHQGYVWLGTTDGLSRYDGYHFRNYHHVPGDSTSLRDNLVKCLYVDGEGRLWVGTDTGLDRYDRNTDTFLHMRNDLPGPDTFKATTIRVITEDKEGDIWFGTPKGIHRIGRVSGDIASYPLVMDDANFVCDIHEDSGRRLWVAIGVFDVRSGAADGIYFFDRTSGSFVPFRLVISDSAAEPAPSVRATSVVEDSRGRIWVGTWGRGLFVLDEQQAVFRRHGPTARQNLNYVKMLYSPAGDRIWIVTSDRDRWYNPMGGSWLSVVDVMTESVDHLPPPSESASTLDVHMGRDSVLWIGTSGVGAFTWDTKTGNFSTIRKSVNETNGFGNNFVRAIYADTDGVVWVGHLDGLDRIDRRAGSVRHYSTGGVADVALPVQRVQTILRDREGSLWIGSIGYGVIRMTGDGPGFDTYRHDPDDPTSLSSDLVKVIHQGADGALWMGTRDAGLNRLGPGRQRFDHFMKGEPGHWFTINALYPDAGGTLWIGTQSGLARYEADADSVVCLHPQSGSPLQFPDAVPVNSIADTPQQPGILWVGTEGHGMIRVDVEAGTIASITTESHGIPHDVVCGILPDEEGRLWISTMRGLARFDPATERMKSYGPERGLQSVEFNRRAYHRGPDGEMFFGGVNGLNTFFPADMVENPHRPRVVLSQVKIRDRSRTGDTARTNTLITAGDMEEAASLSPSQRDLEFDFVAFHFSHPELNTYRYRLDGYDDSWQEAGTRRTAIYTNIEPGTYTFRVAAASAHGVWSEQDATWTFSIRKPAWQTGWFRALVFLVALGAIWGWYEWRTRAQRRRQRALMQEIDHRTADLKDTLSIVEQQKESLGELSSARSRFVANISHELRTPLTLVLGQLQDMREGSFGDVTPAVLKELEVTLRNARRMQRMVDQLLSVARLETGDLKLKVRQGDLAALVRDIHTAFRPLAGRRGIDLQLESPADPVALWFDFDRMEEIVTNLLSNALKFTPEGGRVWLRLSDNPGEGSVVFQVQDTGPGIPGSQLARVFDRFYQGDSLTDAGHPGVGIGLSLAAELAELHGGRITVESEEGKGSRFSVEIPKGKNHFAAGWFALGAGGQQETLHVDSAAIDDMEDLTGLREADVPESIDEATVLIVDDNPDMRRLLRRQFLPRFRVLEAGNGIEGVAEAHKAMPDVIVSDVMMPEMDGYDLCRAVKADSRLEFIPVVLLTARAEMDDKIAGLEGGADDYVVKPFNANELRARIENLIQLRYRLKAIVTEQTGDGILWQGRRGLDPDDAGFLKRLSDTVQSNLSDEDFGIEELAEELRMSRAHLYRRIKEVCERSPAELIIEARLKQAARLLTEKAGSVSEVAYGVGFKSLAHFSRRFKSRYGQSPSEMLDFPAEKSP
jgi:signal transduction histidine kinase/ligand-binding sensor domain-containing protein/DNA-binding response OmpR family regulator